MTDLDHAEMRAEIPDWLHGRGQNPTQLKLFVRWVCRVHHRCHEVKLAQAMGYRISPFKKGLKNGMLQRACYELAVFLGRSLEIPDLQLYDLTLNLKTLADAKVVEGEYGEWHTLANNLRKLWIRSKEE